MTQLLLYNNKHLFDRIAQGDEIAFKELFLHYNGKIYPYFLRKIGVEAIAREMVQDVFFKLWLHRESLKQEGNSENYLFRIAANVLHDYFRKVSREERMKADLQVNAEPAGNMEEEIWLSETRKLLDEAVQDLPPQRRHIYMLRQQGYSYDEIARQLNISPNTVKNQLVAAGKTLRTFLMDRGLAPLMTVFFPLH